ncbi:hypothetical protein MKW92_007024 [Papaver armeniacum]|nr:hypothetical protein MKW92_007024 [Papaver armeniacum]
MARTEYPGEQTNSKKRKNMGGHSGSGSRYPDNVAPVSIRSPGSLIGNASWFDFKGNVAANYSHFVPVHNFPIAPELKDYYKAVVEEHGHVATTVVLADRNSLISSASDLVAVAKSMAEVGDDCPSVETLETWRGSFVLPRLLQFNMGWIEELYKNLEEKRSSRRLVLPEEISALEESILSEAQKLKEQQEEQIRLAAEASKIAADVAETTRCLSLKRKELAEKQKELASFS